MSQHFNPSKKKANVHKIKKKQKMKQAMKKSFSYRRLIIG